MSPRRPRALTPEARAMRAVDVAVDVGFSVLLVICGLRYFAYHELAGVGTVVLVLAIASGVSYAAAVIGARTAPSWHRIWLLTAVGLWLPLVVIAPSFGWCAFALFFAIHRVVTGNRALALSAAVVVAVSVGLYLMSNGTDLGLVLGPFFGGLVLAYAYWALDRALGEQRRLNAELVATREQLANSERVAGAAAERERVASELHDTVAQRTAEALLRLEAEHAASPNSAGSASTRAALRLALTETREFMLGLVTPQDRRPEGLTDALRSLAVEAGAAFEITGVERRLTDESAHALQRVAQEALTNVRKHARATRIKVTLTYFTDAVGLDIADNGDGFVLAEGTPLPETDQLTDRSNAATGSGFGIRAMGWRMRSLGGALTIESTPGGGTAVAATIPTAESTP